MTNRVVVVDDLEANLQLYGAVVQRALGEPALAYDDPIEALHELQSNSASLIIVDYQMPEMDGISLIRALRATDIHAQTPIVMMTANSDQATAAQAMAAGATLFLNKPVPVKELTEHITRYVGVCS